MNLLTLSPAAFCKATNACEEGRKFALPYPSMGGVWDACPRPDWLLWICARLGQRPDDRTLRLFAVWCARFTPLGDGRVTGHLLIDQRFRDALDVAERYAEGRASDDGLVHHRFAVDLATGPLLPSGEFAAKAAVWSALDRLPDAAAFHAAYNAARAPDSTEANAAASAAQADQFRCMVANPFRVGEIKP